MNPAVKSLIEQCTADLPAARRQIILDDCAQLVGICQTASSLRVVWQEARKVAIKARQILPPEEAKRFQKLATLKEDVGHLDYTRLGAHIYHIAGGRA